MIYVTGDTHIPHDIGKLDDENFQEQNNMTKDDFVIICGDFGIFNNNSEELECLKWLERKNFTTLFVDGNHENFEILKGYPIEEWNGGKVQFINSSVIHLMRGQVYSICGYKFFTMGGASSTDRMYREKWSTWWEEELPSEEEYKEGLTNLQKVNWCIDYAITHTCSSSVLNEITKFFGFEPKPEDDVNRYLEIIKMKTTFKHWFFGHFHEDIKVDNRHTLLYEKIVRADDI